MDQTLSVESRELETTINGLSTWQARPTAIKINKNVKKLTDFIQRYISSVLNIKLNTTQMKKTRF